MDTPPAAPAVALPPPAPVPKPRAWPKLTLSAVFAHAGSGRGVARLNNRMVRVGEQIEGVTLVEVLGDAVRLQFGTETRLLKIGTTL